MKFYTIVSRSKQKKIKNQQFRVAWGSIKQNSETPVILRNITNSYTEIKKTTAQSYDLRLSNTAALINDYINMMHSLHLRVSSSAVADHRMAEVDRDLWVPLGPPLLKQRHLEQADAHVQEETLQTLGSLWHCLSPAQSHSCSTLGTVQLLLL